MGRREGCQEKPKGMRSSQTQRRSSRPFQCEDGSPQSTQTSRLNPSSLFERHLDKACPLGSSLRPRPAMVTAEAPGPWEQAKYVPDCPGSLVSSHRWTVSDVVNVCSFLP